MIQRPKITTSEDAYKLLLKIFDRDFMNIKEEAAVLYLNRANRVIGAYRVSSGGITGTVVDPRLILSVALKTLSCGLILAHTHPSGDLRPSRADIDLTEKLKQAAKYMDIQILDHLIITSESYTSVLERD